MRIHVITQGDVPSKWAHSIQVMKMADGLADHADSVTVVTARAILPSPAHRVDLQELYGLRHKPTVCRIPTFRRLPHPDIRSFDNPRFDGLAARHAAWRRPDLVVTRSPLAGALCVQRGVPTVVETHIEGDNVRLPPLIAVAQQDALRGVVTISPSLRDAYVTAGIPSGKLQVLPDAVDPAPFDALPQREVLREELGLPTEGPLCVYAGHLYPHRGVETMLDAAARLPGVRFVLVGGWDEDVKRRQEEAAHLSNVAFPGFVPGNRVPRWLGAADVVLLPYSSRVSSAAWMSPMKLFEAMACGRPLIASALPALQLHVESGRNGLLVAPDDGAALAQGVQRLIDDPVLAGRLAGAARKDVQEHTWSARARALLDRFA